MTMLDPDEALRPLVRKYTARSLGRKFTEASKIRDSGIEVVQSTSKGNGNRYRISLESSVRNGEHKRFRVIIRPECLAAA